MKFLCLCYYDTAAFERLSPADAAKIEPACKPHDERLRATGKVPVIGSFAMPGEWTSFVPEDGRACERPVASKHPAANFGEELGFAVEIRRCELYQEGESK